MPTPHGYSIVPINPKTGKLIRKPRQRQKVKLALRGPKGGLTILRPEPQEYYKGDFKALNRSVENIQGGNFVTYEQRTRKIKRTKTGKKMYRTDKEGNKIPVYETKITGAKPAQNQRALLYVRGRRRRDLDIGFTRGHKRVALTKQRMFLAKPNVLKPIAITLTGKTIKESLDQLQLNVTLPMVKQATQGLFFTVIITIQKPDGSIIRIPVNSAWTPKDIAKKSFTNLPGSLLYPKGSPKSKLKNIRYPAERYELDKAANLHSKISSAVRQSLKSHGGGLRFTTLVTLNEIEKKASTTELAQNRKRRDWDSDKERVFKDGINRIKQLDTTTKAKDLNQIQKDWKVTLYIRFELY